MKRASPHSTDHVYGANYAPARLYDHYLLAGMRQFTRLNRQSMPGPHSRYLILFPFRRQIIAANLRIDLTSYLRHLHQSTVKMRVFNIFRNLAIYATVTLASPAPAPDAAPEPVAEPQLPVSLPVPVPGGALPTVCIDSDLSQTNHLLMN